MGGDKVEEERSTTDVIRSSRSLHLFLHYNIRNIIRDKIERSPKRNSAVILYATPR